MTREYLGSFTINQEFTNKFAELSGDFNPLHMDPLKARRYYFGSTVVHGLGVVLKSLDLLLSSIEHPVYLDNMQVKFNQPIVHDELIELFTWKDGLNYFIEVSSRNKNAHIIKFSIKERSNLGKLSPLSPDPNPVCEHLALAQARGHEATLNLTWNPPLFEEIFPAFKKVISEPDCATLLALTNIVGMKCPGINSVFAGFKIAFKPDSDLSDDSLSFRVKHIDERFSLARIGISNNVCTGEIEAIFRPEPIKQMSYQEIRGIIPHNLFSNQVALIIGGSRGVGEITAKLIAAGGGQVLVTYARGKDDAKNVKDEIRQHGGNCEIFQYDILSSNPTLHDNLAAKTISHIYYFASPFIQKSDASIIDNPLLHTFLKFYVHSFSRLVDEFVGNRQYINQPMRVFIPSSVFLDERPKGFTEYCIAKAAAEELCQQLEKKYPNWSMHAPRLPRMLTDQTSGIPNQSTDDTVRVILEQLQLIQGNSGSVHP